MQTYKCNKCGMSINATCGQCDAPLVNDVLKLDKTNANAYFTKGMIYHYLGNKSLAISSYQTAIEMDADYYDAYMNLGLLFSEQNDINAIEYYNSAIDIFPSSIDSIVICNVCTYSCMPPCTPAADQDRRCDKSRRKSFYHRTI